MSDKTAKCLEACPVLPDWDGNPDTLKPTLQSWGALYEQCEAKRGICASCLGGK